MSTINFDNTAPPAGPGTFNVSWQNDVFGNLAAMYTIPPFVSSVQLSMPPEFAVTTGPITGAGTINVIKAAAQAGFVWAGPVPGSGVSSAQPIFRQLAPADLPTGTGLGSVTSVGLQTAAPLSELTVTVTGVGAANPITGSGTFVLNKASQTAATVWAGPVSGGAAQPTFRGLAATDLAPWYPPITFTGGVTTLNSPFTIQYNAATPGTWMSFYFPTSTSSPTIITWSNLININAGISVNGYALTVESADTSSRLSIYANNSQPPVISSAFIPSGSPYTVLQITSLLEVINTGGLSVYASDISNSINIMCPAGYPTGNRSGSPQMFSSTGNIQMNGQVSVVCPTSGGGFFVSSNTQSTYLNIYVGVNASPTINTPTSIINWVSTLSGNQNVTFSTPASFIFSQTVFFQSAGGILIDNLAGNTTLQITSPNGGDPYISMGGAGSTNNVNWYPRLTVLNQLVVDTAIGGSALVINPASTPTIATTSGYLQYQGNLQVTGAISGGQVGSGPALAAASPAAVTANQVSFYMATIAGVYHLWVDYAGADGVPHQAQLV